MNTAMTPGKLGDNRFKLGLFGLNAKRGLTATTAPTTFDYHWDHSSRVARRADELGLEFLIPVARYLGFGQLVHGPSDYQGESYETYTWAAGISAITKDITVAATVHLPTVHPIVAAKQSVTVDHISNGRFAINLVMGWFPPEFEMFGSPQRGHAERYAFGAEWLEIVERLWEEEEPFDLEGEFFRLQHAISRPKPGGGKRPLLFNAGNSDSGIDYSAKYVDFNFATISDTASGAGYVEKIRTMANDKYQRDIGVLTFGTVVCRPSEAEAQDAYEEIRENADWVSVGAVTESNQVESDSFSEQIKKHYERMATSGGGIPLIGTPEQIAEEFRAISETGIDGFAMCFLDYGPELEFVAAEVLPILQRMGLRR